VFNSDTITSAAPDLRRVTNASGNSIASTIERYGKLFSDDNAATTDRTASHDTTIASAKHSSQDHTAPSQEAAADARTDQEIRHMDDRPGVV
jgi:hypothetical protein